MTPEEIANRSAEQQAKKPMSVKERISHVLPDPGDTREQPPQPKTRDDVTAEKLAIELPDVHPNGQPPPGEEEVVNLAPVEELTAEDFGPTDPEGPPLSEREQRDKALETNRITLQQEQAHVLEYAQALNMRQQELQGQIAAGQYDDATALAIHQDMQKQWAAVNQAAAVFQNKAVQHAKAEGTRFDNELIERIPLWSDKKIMSEHMAYLSQWLGKEKRLSLDEKKALTPPQIAEYHSEMMADVRQRRAKRLKTIRKVPTAKDSGFYRGVKGEVNRNKQGKAPLSPKDEVENFADKVRSAKKHADDRGMNPFQKKKYIRELVSSKRL